MWLRELHHVTTRAGQSNRPIVGVGVFQELHRSKKTGRAQTPRCPLQWIPLARKGIFDSKLFKPHEIPATVKFVLFSFSFSFTLYFINLYIHILVNL